MNLIDQIGSTAFIIAAFRAEESKRDIPLFRDDHAQYFLDDEMVEKAREMARIMPTTESMIRYRVRYFGDKISQYIQNDTTQVVLLGGGFDMRVCNYAGQGARFFDVDQSPVLNHKKDVIEQNGIHYPSTFVPCNYIEDDVISVLDQSGFDRMAPTLFIWEGNCMYIPDHLIYGLFDTFQAHIDRFAISFDYVSTSIINHTTGRQELTDLAQLFEDMGSPWITGFDDIHSIEKHSSLRVAENVPMRQLEQSLEPNKPPIDEDLIKTYSVCTIENN